jgi:L-2,4-diaminobutyrate decarboxylase
MTNLGSTTRRRDPTVTADPYDPNGFRRDGHALVDMLADHLDSTSRLEGKVLDHVAPPELLYRWTGTFQPGPGTSLVDLMPQLLRESHHLYHPHYVGHQVSSPLPSAALAELVSAMLNNGTAEYEMGPVSNVMERRLVDLSTPTSTRCAGIPEDAISELTLAAASGEAARRFDRALSVITPEPTSGERV